MAYFLSLIFQLFLNKFNFIYIKKKSLDNIISRLNKKINI